MRLFLISNMYPGSDGDLFGVFVKNMRQELENQGVGISQSALMKGKSTNFLKKIIRYSKHYLQIFFLFFFSKSMYDLIYIHFITHHIPILLLLLSFKKKPWIINAHGQDIITLIEKPIINYFAKPILKQTNLLVVPSHYFKTLILEHYPFLNENNIFVSPSGGIDPKRFFSKNEKKVNSSLTLGFVSRFIQAKGWLVFLEALLLLQEQKIEFKAIIAGKGPDEQKIKTYIEQHELQDSVEFLGFVKQDELVNLYNKFDLYIFPTYRKSESLGLTGLEAMACGTPVIASNIAGPKTYIEEEKNGYLFEPENSRKLAKKIIAYKSLTHTAKNQLQNKAVKTAADYEKSTVAKKLLDRLRRLV